MARFEPMMEWLAKVYMNALNSIHYMHDKYMYERLEMALHDRDILRTMACGIAGLSVVADSLSAIKHAKVKVIRDEKGLATDFEIEGDYPAFGNNDARVDDIAVWTVERFGMKGVVKALELWGEGKKTPEVIKGAFGVTPEEYDKGYRQWQLGRLSRYKDQYIFTLKPRDLDEVFGDEGPAERGGQRVPVLVHRAGLQGRQHEVARELVAQVEHVCPGRAERQRPLARIVELLALAEIHRHGDDLGPVLLGQPGNGYRGVESARVRENYPLHERRSLPITISPRRASTLAAASMPRHTSRIVSSPAIVPATSESWARSIHSASPCAWPRSVRRTSSGSTRSNPRSNVLTARRSCSPEASARSTPGRT